MKHIVTEHKLTSGAQGLTIHLPASNIFRIIVRFNTGFQFADRQKYELPHVVEHLMGCGSQGYPKPDEFKIEVERNGAARNAFTSSQKNGYFIECADFERDRILDLFEEYIARPVFPETSFATEISNVREELIRSTTQHGSVCSINLFEQIAPKEYLNYDARIAQLASITRDDVISYYERKYTAANARFYVVGDMPDGGVAVAARLEKIFRQLPRGIRLLPVEEPGQGLTTPIITQRDIQTVYYELIALGEGMERPKRTALTMLRLLLIGGSQSRVYGRARREGLAYSLSVSAGASHYDSDISFDGYVSPDKLTKLFGIYREELTRLQAGDLTDQELEGPKNLGIGSTERSMQTPSDILSWYVGPYDTEEYIRDYDQYLEQLRDVTAKEVLERLQEVLSQGARATSLLGNFTESEVKDFSLAAAKVWS